MKLKEIAATDFVFKRDLPPDLIELGPDGCKSVWVEVHARAGGSVNPKLTADYDKIDQMETVLDRLSAGNVAVTKDEIAAEVSGNIASEREISFARFGAIYDNCVVSWSTNICDEDNEGNPLAGTRENFLALADVKFAGIAAFFGEFIEATVKVSEIATDAEEDTVKN